MAVLTTDSAAEAPERELCLDADALRQSKRLYRFFKRLQDIVLSAVGLVVLFPLLLVIALLVYVDDPRGSPLFVQERIGLRGKPFKFYKFRTMYVDAEDDLHALMIHNEKDGPVFKIKDDPRITRIGKFLRKTSLDELPQLWNILLGDMTIVGPRPPLPRETAQYTPYYWQRLYVTPGLTCYWQIQPRRDDICFEDWVEMDLQYIRERNFLVDWKIIFQTVGAVIRASGE